MLLAENVDYLLEQIFAERPLCSRPWAGHREDRGALVHTFVYLFANDWLITWCMSASGPGGGDTEKNEIRLIFLGNSHLLEENRKANR